MKKLFFDCLLISSLFLFIGCPPETISGCMDQSACNYDQNAEESDNSCDYSCLGCIDEEACNYDITATNPDNSCIYPDGICETCENGQIIDNDSDDDGVCDADEIPGCTDCTYGCDYNADATDSVDCDYSCVGCTDTSACNYNPDATIPADCNFSCLGCLDPNACNYNPESFGGGNCFYESSPPENAVEITFVEENVCGKVGEEIISHVYVRNASCDDMTGLVVRKFFNDPDAAAYFCFNGICFPSITNTSPNPLDLEPMEEDDYFKGYLNADIPGIFEVTYRFYLEDDPSQFAETIITYQVN